MKIEGSYIQYASGYQKDNIDDSDVERALSNLPDMDNEHGSFWIGVYGINTDEFVVEIQKNLETFGNLGEDQNYKKKLDNIKNAKEYFSFLLVGKIDKLKKKFNKKIT